MCSISAQGGSGQSKDPGLKEPSSEVWTQELLWRWFSLKCSLDHWEYLCQSAGGIVIWTRTWKENMWKSFVQWSSLRNRRSVYTSQGGDFELAFWIITRTGVPKIVQHWHYPDQFFEERPEIQNPCHAALLITSHRYTLRWLAVGNHMALRVSIFIVTHKPCLSKQVFKVLHGVGKSAAGIG